ncbi:MAG TPA: ROK family transcriptional regulator [Gaiellaceae bacterium]|jgi:predicted NBD/HSP70 family sugar kinase/DNA-binding CsgD family transcriptional regulator|nr:ROK family transcriptional regulator [Gaiellaceae bacterium]
MARPRPRPAIPPLLKHLNERTVLETIREGAPISRAEISRRAGISKPTVSLALRSLLEAGLVRETSHNPGRPSYGALYFEPTPDAAFVLGFDLGARFLRGAACDLTGEIRARQDVELPATDAETAVETIAALRTSLVDAAAIPEDVIDGVVVGVPGVVESQTGRINLALNVPGLEGRLFDAELNERLGLRVTLENDINLAALGEHWRGVARGVDNFAFLSIGTGLGAGIVLRGELHRGHHGAAGEVDYALGGLQDDLDPSAAAVSALAAQLVDGRPDTVLAPPYDVRAIFAEARGGDGVAREVVEEVARRIAMHLAPIAAVADVALVVLGGGLGANGDLLLEPVRGLLADWMPYPPRVEVSSLGEAAVLTGALAVGLRAALDSVFVNRAGAVPA